jgi:hypothetical protein
MDDEISISQGKKPDEPIYKEVPSNAHIPIYKLEAQGKPISDEVVNEIERATLVTFQTLDIDISEYEKGVKFDDLIDVWAKNKQDLRTFPRKPKMDNGMLAIVVSTLPVYDHKHREVIAIENDNVTFINLRKIDDQFAEGSKKPPLEIMAGIATVEEVIHHIQHAHWGKERKGTTDTMHDINLHIQDEVEAEANPLKKKVYQKLYPALGIKVKGIDF